MKRIFYILYLVWAVACIVLKIFGLIGWWGATSFIWLPLGALLTASVAIFGIADYGEYRKSKIPHTCDNCVFRLASELISDANGEKMECIGRRLNVAKDNTCEYLVLDKEKERVI